MEKKFTINNIDKLKGESIHLLNTPLFTVITTPETYTYFVARMYDIDDVYSMPLVDAVGSVWKGDWMEIGKTIIHRDGRDGANLTLHTNGSTKFGWIPFEDMLSMAGFISALGRVKWYSLRTSVTHNV